MEGGPMRDTNSLNGHMYVCYEESVIEPSEAPSESIHDDVGGQHNSHQSNADLSPNSNPKTDPMANEAKTDSGLERGSSIQLDNITVFFSKEASLKNQSLKESDVSSNLFEREDSTLPKDQHAATVKYEFDQSNSMINQQIGNQNQMTVN